MESMPQEHSVWEGASRGGSAPECEAGTAEFRPDEAANDMRMSQLARTIELEIIPRLMPAHRVAAEPAWRPAVLPRAVTEADIHQFAKLVLSHEEDVAVASVQTFLTRGVSIKRIFLDLLAPTARYLGHLWAEDLCNFTDVTVGLGRLQRVLREMSPALGLGVEHPAQGRRVLLLPSPGEQHTFGLVMVGEVFSRAGWNVTGGAWAAGAEAPALVGAEWFDVLGFSLGAEVHLKALAGTICAVRDASCNRELAILVGGPIFASHPEFVGLVGADGMAADGREAPTLAEGLIAKATRRHALQG